MKKLQDKISTLFDKEHSLFTSSGTTALWLALKALGLRNKKIIVPANVCFVVSCAIYLSENEPYYLDIDDYFSIDPRKLRDLTEVREIGAVIVPHMYGEVASIEEIIGISKTKGWPVIEDVAQALGARRAAGSLAGGLAGKSENFAGSFADISMTSFGQGKIIEAGSGGLFLANDQGVFEEARRLYEGLPLKTVNDEEDYQFINKKYFDIVCSLDHGLAHGKISDEELKKIKGAFIHRQIYDDEYFEKLNWLVDELPRRLSSRSENSRSFSKILRSPHVEVLSHSDGATYWRQNVLCSDRKNELTQYLRRNGVKASNYFPRADLIFEGSESRAAYPKTQRFYEQVINLWPGQETTTGDIVQMNQIVNEFYRVKSP